MKLKNIVRLGALFGALFYCPLASAQNAGTVTANAFAVGKGPGVKGYGSLLCATTQIPIGQTSAAALCKTVSGDMALSANGVATLASTIAAGGPTGSATVAPIITYDAKGRITAVSSATITPAVGSITGLGTGIATALGVNVGTAGSPVVNGGALGTPSSGTATNLAGTAASLTAGHVTTNANLTGDVTSVGNASTIANNAVTNAKSAEMAAVTLKGNPTASLANASDFTISGLTATASPDAALDYMLIWDHTAGTLKKVNPGTIASSATSGVSSLGGMTGAVTCGTGLACSAATISSTNVSSQWVTSGSDIYFNSGNVGIGTTPDPSYALKIAQNQNSPVQAAILNPNAGASATTSLLLGNNAGAAGLIQFSSAFSTPNLLAVVNEVTNGPITINPNGTGKIILNGSTQIPSVTSSYLATDSSGTIVGSPLATRCMNIMNFGGNPNGTASPNTNDAPMASLMATAASAGVSPCAYFPSGTYYFSAGVTYSFSASSSPSGVSFIGDGPGSSNILFHSTDGFKITYNGNINSAKFDGLSILTDGTAYTGIEVDSTVCRNAGKAQAQTVFNNLTIAGTSYGSNYWSGGVVTSGVSFTTWNAMNLYGSPNGSAADQLVTITGNPSCGSGDLPFAIWHQMTNMGFQGGGVGLVVGDYTQGVNISNFNFQTSAVGILTSGTGGGTANLQLTVANGQFGPAAGGFGIKFEAAYSGSNVHHVNFYNDPSGAGRGIYVAPGVQQNFSSFDHNQFVCNATTTDAGIDIEQGSGNVIDGNFFTNCGYSVFLGAATDHNVGNSNNPINTDFGNTNGITDNGTSNAVH